MIREEGESVHARGRVLERRGRGLVERGFSYEIGWVHFICGRGKDTLEAEIVYN